jgi:hypothetical protein
MISTDKKRQNKPKARQPGSGTNVQEPTVHNTNRAAKKASVAPRVGKQELPQTAHHYQTQRTSKGSPPLYMIAVGTCVLLVGAYAIYVSITTSKPWSPVPEGGGSFEPQTMSAAQPEPALPEQIPQANVTSPPNENRQQSFHPNAVIDVPKVGLRNMPDIALKATVGDLKRGERVEIVRKISGKGPKWVKIKTKSSKVGWIFASLVREQKGG